MPRNSLVTFWLLVLFLPMTAHSMSFDISRPLPLGTSRAFLQPQATTAWSKDLEQCHPIAKQPTEVMKLHDDLINTKNTASVHLFYQSLLKASSKFLHHESSMSQEKQALLFAQLDLLLNSPQRYATTFPAEKSTALARPLTQALITLIALAHRARNDATAHAMYTAISQARRATNTVTLPYPILHEKVASTFSLLYEGYTLTPGHSWHITITRERITYLLLALYTMYAAAKYPDFLAKFKLNPLRTTAAALLDTLDISLVKRLVAALSAGFTTFFSDKRGGYFGDSRP